MNENCSAFFGLWSQPLQTTIRINPVHNEYLDKIYGKSTIVPWESILARISDGHFCFGEKCSCGEKKIRLFVGMREHGWIYNHDHDLEVCLKCKTQKCHSILI